MPVAGRAARTSFIRGAAGSGICEDIRAVTDMLGKKGYVAVEWQICARLIVQSTRSQMANVAARKSL